MLKAIKTLGSISGDLEEEGFVHEFDTIEHEGKMWLVSKWLVALDGTHQVPERIICLDPLPHRNVGLDEQTKSGVRFCLLDPIPRAVLDGVVPPGEETLYVVVHRPNIQAPRGSRPH